MKKIFIVTVILTGLAVPAFSVGAGLGVFVPFNGGIPDIPFGINPNMPIGKYFNIPLGLNYTKIYGLAVEDAAGLHNNWFYTDTLSFHIGLGVKIPINKFFLSLEGAWIGSWNMSLNPLTGNIDRDLARSLGYDTVTSTLTNTGRLGSGYQFGGSFGMKVNPQLSVSLLVLYVNTTYPLALGGSYTYTSGTNSGSGVYDPGDTSLKLEGLKISVQVDYKI